MLLSKLCSTFGVSGYENEIRKLIYDEIRGYVDEVFIDNLGNLIAKVNGTQKDRKKIMVSAHLDEIGFQVIKIDETGLLKVKTIGGVPNTACCMNRVTFKNGIQGLIVSPIENSKELIHNGDIYIDIGANSKDEVLRYIKIGDVAAFKGELVELIGRNITAKALDNRAGCFCLIECIKKIKLPPNDIFFVFTSQEEIGARGALVAANRVNPDVGINVDITLAGDYPNSPEGSCKIGGGVAIKISDGSVICDSELVDMILECCREREVKYQIDITEGGNTDATAINCSNLGVRVIGISIAARYFHGPNALINLNDIEATISILSYALQIKNFVDILTY